MDFKPDTSAHFLIVDDDEIFARRLALALSTRGFQTETATTLKTAYAALATGRFDVLITDLRIADDSGLELVKAMDLLAIVQHPGDPGDRHIFLPLCVSKCQADIRVLLDFLVLVALDIG